MSKSYSTVNRETCNASEIDPLDRWQSEFVYLGTITSAVDSDQYPEEEFQSNEASDIGLPVYRYGDDLVLCFNGQYWVYTTTQGE